MWQRRTQLWIVLAFLLVIGTPLLLHAYHAHLARNLEAERVAVASGRYITASIEDEELVPGYHRIRWVIKNHASVPAHGVQVISSCKRFFTPSNGSADSDAGQYGPSEFASGDTIKESLCDCDSTGWQFGKAYSKQYIESLHCREDLELKYIGYSGKSYQEKHCYYLQAKERKQIDCSLPDNQFSAQQNTSQTP